MCKICTIFNRGAAVREGRHELEIPLLTWIHFSRAEHVECVKGFD